MLVSIMATAPIIGYTPFAFAQITITPGKTNLLSIDNNDNFIYKINPDTAATISSVIITLDGSFSPGSFVNGGTGIAFNPADEKIYALLKISDDPGSDLDEDGAGGGLTRHLATIDPQTGIATLIGDTGVKKIASLTFNSGTLFSVNLSAGGTNTGTISTISTVDGSVTRLCALVTMRGTGLAFNPNDELLYYTTGSGFRTINFEVDPCGIEVIPVTTTNPLQNTGALAFFQSFLIIDEGEDLESITEAGVLEFIGFLDEHNSRGLTKVRMPTVCFYNDSPSTTFHPGHTFLQLINDNIPNSEGQVYGFHPSNSIFIFGEGGGQVRDDSLHSWDWKICYDITREQYNTLVSFVTSSIITSPPYHLISENCVTWISRAAGTIGISLPDFKNPAGILDPFKIDETLEAAGDGGVIGLGFVHENTDGVTPIESQDSPTEFPDQCSYDGIVSFALQDSEEIGSFALQNSEEIGSFTLQSSEEIASIFHLNHFTSNLDPILVGVGEEILVEIVNADTANSIIFLDWGDGSNTAQEQSAVHTYTSLGLFEAKFLIMNKASLAEHILPIQVVIDPQNPNPVVLFAPPTTGEPFPYILPPPTLPKIDSGVVGDGRMAVGGELIPLDTTSLLLAGTYSNAAWMIPVIVSAIGIGIVIARKF